MLAYVIRRNHSSACCYTFFHSAVRLPVISVTEKRRLLVDESAMFT